MEGIVNRAEEIAKREGMSFSSLIIKLIEDHVKVHTAGNPSHEIDKWIEQPEFIGHPAVAESNEKWDRYLSQCDEKEIAHLEGVFIKRREQAKEAWLRKKRNE